MRTSFRAREMAIRRHQCSRGLDVAESALSTRRRAQVVQPACGSCEAGGTPHRPRGAAGRHAHCALLMTTVTARARNGDRAP